jgi:hypothetical protein
MGFQDEGKMIARSVLVDVGRAEVLSQVDQRASLREVGVRLDAMHLHKHSSFVYATLLFIPTFQFQ